MSKYSEPIRSDKSNDWIEKYKGEYYSGIWPTIPQLLEMCCNECPDKVFLETFVPEHLTFTYREVVDLVRKISEKIKKIATAPNSKIIVSGVNSPEWAICYLAIQYSGNIVIPLDNTLHKEEVVNLTKFCDSKIAFVDSRKKKFFEGLDMNVIISLDKEELDSGLEYVCDWAKDISLVKSDAEYKIELFEKNEEDTAAILFTSGTTGNPKGVMLSFRNLVGDTYLAQTNMIFYREDVFYAILPIHHAYAMVAAFMVPLSQGCRIVFGKKMVPKHIFYDVKEGGVTVFLGVPALFNKVIIGLMNGIKAKGILVYGLIKFLMGFFAFLKAFFRINCAKNFFRFITSKVSLDNVRILISGGGPLAPIVVKQYNRLGLQFVEGYGMTETSPVTNLNPIEAYKYGSVGRSVGEVTQIIKDPDEEGNGVIWVKGPMVMQGYYKNEQATKEIMDENGFLNTGDIGHIDKDKYLFLTGRAKNIIVTAGGKNVFPEEIENEFQLFDEVEEVMIAGYVVDSSEKIMAIVQPSEAIIKQYADDKISCEKRIQLIVDAVNKNLSSYKKITKLVVTYEPFPLSSTRKIKRVEAMKMLKSKGLI